MGATLLVCAEAKQPVKQLQLEQHLADLHTYQTARQAGQQPGCNLADLYRDVAEQARQVMQRDSLTADLGLAGFDPSSL